MVNTSDTGVKKLAKPVEIRGLRCKGYNKVTTSKDGETVTSSVIFRTPDKIVVGSKLDGHTVMDCVAIDSFADAAGYLSYCK